MDRHKLALIIPAYNESATITEVVKGVLEYGQPIVVNDCSSDDTARLALKAGAIVVNHDRNLGYDAALNTGFEAAASGGFQYVITFDADGQHNPIILEYFIAEFDKGVKLVLGVRNAKARFAENVFGMYTKICYGVNDPLCGLKGYSMDLYLAIGHFDTYKSIGTELMLRLLLAGERFCQIKFEVRDRADMPRFGRLISANYRILRSMLVWMVYK